MLPALHFSSKKYVQAEMETYANNDAYIHICFLT